MDDLNWRNYQQATAEFFRSLGYDTKIEEKLEGIRGQHNVDVVVRFRKNAFSCIWLVECKLWSSNIPKEKVLAFQSIIEDVGADKGIILSEKGFQSGCFACANRTNILLSSLSQLRETHQEDLHHAVLDSLLVEIERATSKARKLAPIISNSRPGDKVQSWKSKFPVELLGRIACFEMALNRYRDGHLPVFASFGDDGNTPILASSLGDIIKAQQELLDRINRLCATLESGPKH